ncbi:MAG: DNA polymerase III subunit chi [Gammaproteobacteria bacterium]|nr:MAG: DNA polymerase III subunit chi [Gammaproteobacteria bacterium]
MTRVDFYILSDDSSRNLEIFACRLTEKAYAQGMKIYINTKNQQQTQSLNSLLWTFKQESFLPHEVALENSPSESPIMIGHGIEPEQSCGLLINLDQEVPLFFSQFERLAELVNQNPQVRDKGRERFRFYKDREYQINSHKMGST